MKKNGYKTNRDFKIIDIASEDDMENIRQEKEKLYIKSDKAFTKRRKYPFTKNTYKLGTLFNVNGTKMAYLFTIDGYDYCVDIENYIKKPLTSCIKSISRYKTIGDIPLLKCKRIINKLYNKKASPFHQIEELYDKLKRIYN